MELFFTDRIEDNQLLLGEEESHHCLKVMRHRIGDELFVTDGKGKLVRARLQLEHKKIVELELIEVVKEEPHPSPSIHVAIAPTKNIDRFEWFLEKATEIGVTEITPIICQRSERHTIKHERLEKVLIGAMKQSLRLWLPKLNVQIALKNFLSQNSKPETLNFICHCQSPNIPSLKSLYKPNKDVTIMIGPEGDFTQDEIELAESNGFTGVTLGSNRLRTETAGIIAIHTIKLLNS